MNKVKKNILKTLVCLVTLTPVMSACSCTKDAEQSQKIEYKITKGNAPHGTYTLEFDNKTKKVKVIATPDNGYEFVRAYYVHTKNPTVEYTIEEEGFTKPNADVTVYVVFEEKEPEAPILTAKLNLQQTNNGTILVDNTSPVAGDTVKITVIPSEGYFASKLYYIKNDNSEVEISSSTFTMIDEPIVVKAEFTKFYGTYKLAAISNNLDEDSILEEYENSLAFVNIDTKLTIGSIIDATDNKKAYVTNTYSYLINDNVITYVDENDKVYNLTLSNGKYNIVEDNSVYEFRLINDIDFSFGRYDRIDYTSSDLDYIWDIDGSIKEISSKNTGEFISEVNFGNAKLYGDILIIDSQTYGCKIVVELNKETNYYSLKGYKISYDNNYDEVEWSFAIDNTRGKTTLAETKYGTAHLEYNSSTDKVEVIATPNSMYVVNEIYYIVEGSNTKHNIPTTGFDRPSGDNITIYVTFKVDPNYPIRAEVNNTTGGNIKLNTLDLLQVGDRVSISVTPDEGYYLKEVYYLTSDNQKVVINNNEFTLIEDVITIEATFIKYYGTYFVSNLVDGNGNTIPGASSVLENNAFNFIHIDETGAYMPLIETIEERYYSKYEILKGTYTIDSEKITLTFRINGSNVKQELYLADGNVKSLTGTDTYLLFTLARDSGFVPGPYQVNEITESITEFIFNDDGTVTSTTNGNRSEIGTYKQYGNMLIIENYDNTLDICILTKNNNTVIISGIRIFCSNPDTSVNNTTIFYWTFIAK